MWALGDKVASSIVAQTADIPTLPWSGSGDSLPLSLCHFTSCIVALTSLLTNIILKLIYICTCIPKIVCVNVVVICFLVLQV